MQVSQEPVLYARSIRQNILYGLEAENGVPPEEVSAACRAHLLLGTWCWPTARLSTATGLVSDTLTTTVDADPDRRGHSCRHKGCQCLELHPEHAQGVPDASVPGFLHAPVGYHVRTPTRMTR